MKKDKPTYTVEQAFVEMCFLILFLFALVTGLVLFINFHFQYLV